ncbi:c-type cytochrome [Puniceibacterium confluentis]|uniref:c-type cytochrome n=1 Tax=Puniceibacterium confluentis TaxID=1958944 RepID=UPI003569A863
MRTVLPATLVAAVTVTALTAWAAGGNAQTAEVTFLGAPVGVETIARGNVLYAESCASCHGIELEGQPDWRRRLDNGRMPAPPHDADGHTWHHADRQLFTITKHGLGAILPGYDSDMPAFGELLSDEEIAAVLAYIKSTWPERERGFQAEVTAGDTGGT